MCSPRRGARRAGPRGTAEKLGRVCRVVRTVEALREAVGVDRPDLVLLDLNADGFTPAEAIETVRVAHPRARIVAFVSHVDRELAEAARQATADDVMARSAFVKKLPELLAAS